MRSEQEVRSLRRRLRTFVNRGRQELNVFSAVQPRTPQEQMQVMALSHRLNQLVGAAEQTLAIIDWVTNAEGADDSDNYNKQDFQFSCLLDIWHFANAMYENHGGCFFRRGDYRRPTENDVAWATDRRSLFTLICELLGIPNDPNFTVEKLMKGHMLPAETPQGFSASQRPRRQTPILRSAAEAIGLRHDTAPPPTAADYVKTGPASLVELLRGQRPAAPPKREPVTAPVVDGSSDVIEVDAVELADKILALKTERYGDPDAEITQDQDDRLVEDVVLADPRIRNYFDNGGQGTLVIRNAQML